LSGGVRAANRPRKSYTRRNWSGRCGGGGGGVYLEGLISKLRKKTTTLNARVFFFIEKPKLHYHIEHLGDKHWRAQLKIH